MIILYYFNYDNYQCEFTDYNISESCLHTNRYIWYYFPLKNCIKIFYYSTNITCFVKLLNKTDIWMLFFVWGKENKRGTFVESAVSSLSPVSDRVMLPLNKHFLWDEEQHLHYSLQMGTHVPCTEVPRYRGTELSTT